MASEAALAIAIALDLTSVHVLALPVLLFARCSPSLWAAPLQLSTLLPGSSLAAVAPIFQPWAKSMPP